MKLRPLLLAFFISFCSYGFNRMSASNESKIPIASVGKLEHILNFQSKFVESRNIDVWLPSNYNRLKKYAVIYMHDGQVLFDPGFSWLKKEWHVDEMMSKLLQEQKVKDTIIVAIWNSGTGRVGDYFPEKAFNLLSKDYVEKLRIRLDKDDYTKDMIKDIHSDNYLKFIVKELKPFVDQKYSTLPDRDNTFIMGSSYGGLISLYAISEYPEVFSAAACLSTHWIGTFEDNPTIAKAFIDYFSENIPSPETHRIYFDYGSESHDQYYKKYQLQIDKIMKAKGYTTGNWTSLEFIGEDHSEGAWSRRLDIPLEFLLGTKTK